MSSRNTACTEKSIVSLSIEPELKEKPVYSSIT